MNNYQEYLKSEGWKAKRAMILNMWGNRCALCNKSGVLHLHHRDYSKVGNEEVTDVIPLCELHHRLIHKPLPMDELEELHRIILVLRERIETEQDTLQEPNHQETLYQMLHRLYKRFIFVVKGL